ncbi:hypothetical protein E3P92_02704 [Wallemia ichthyophaga]|nr:hypothetical protein E3P92_02704 [Wallemia ichthyophaga]
MLQELLAFAYEAPSLPIPNLCASLVLPLQARLLVAPPSNSNTTTRVVLLFLAISVAALGETPDTRDNFIIGFTYNVFIFASCMHSVHLTFTTRSRIDTPKIISFSQHDHHDLGWGGAVEMLTNLRGIGMSWGIAHEKLPAVYENFASSLLLDIVKHHVISLSAMAALSRFGQHNHGKTLCELVGCDVAITVAMFGLAWSAITLAYNIYSLCVYTLAKLCDLPFDNYRWPPLFGNPLAADSIRTFWNDKWQCSFRRHFIMCGYKPVFHSLNSLCIPGDIPHYCGIIGAFTVSGLLHEYCIRCTSGKMLMYGSYPTFKFFIISGLAIVVENLVKECTGRRVGGIYGRLWTWSLLFIPALHMSRQCLLAFGPMSDFVDWEVQIVTLATIAALAAALPQGGEPPSGTASETSMSTMPTESTSMPGETSTMPPEETSTMPPEETSTMPPEETSTMPPEETSTMPPEETSTMPPEETSTMPPEETSTMPPDSTSTMPNGVPAPTETGMAIHPNGNMSKCVDVAGAEFSNGTPVQIYDCNDTEAQKFVFTEGETKVKVANHDYCLDAGSDPAFGTMAKIWQCYEDLDAQSFYYTDDYRMAVLGEGLCLDLTDGMMANGTVLQTWKDQAGTEEMREQKQARRIARGRHERRGAGAASSYRIPRAMRTMKAVDTQAQLNDIAEFVKQTRRSKHMRTRTHLDTDTETDTDVTAHGSTLMGEMRRRHEREVAALKQTHLEEISAACRYLREKTQPSLASPLSNAHDAHKKRRRGRDSGILSLDTRDTNITQEQINMAINQRDRFLREAARKEDTSGRSETAHTANSARTVHTAHDIHQPQPRRQSTLPSISLMFPGYFDRSRGDI